MKFWNYQIITISYTNYKTTGFKPLFRTHDLKNFIRPISASSADCASYRRYLTQKFCTSYKKNGVKNIDSRSIRYNDLGNIAQVITGDQNSAVKIFSLAVPAPVQPQYRCRSLKNL